MTPTEILIAAREKIERGWTQGAHARDRRGKSTPASRGSAVCWCPQGAIGAVSPPEEWKKYRDALGLLEAAVGTNLIPSWNDIPGRTQAEVLAAFDKAIEASKRTPEGKGQP